MERKKRKKPLIINHQSKDSIMGKAKKLVVEEEEIVMADVEAIIEEKGKGTKDAAVPILLDFSFIVPHPPRRHKEIPLLLGRWCSTTMVGLRRC